MEYYVYVYLDPMIKINSTYDNYCFLYEPFYIGYGKGNRYLQHLTASHLNKVKNSLKRDRINLIKRNKLSPIIIKLIRDISKDEARNLEVKLIDCIGRKCLGKGTLLNIHKGGSDSRTSGIGILEYDLQGKYKSSYKSLAEIKRNNGFVVHKNILNTYKESNGGIWFENTVITPSDTLDVSKIITIPLDIKNRIQKCRETWNNREMFVFDYKTGDLIIKSQDNKDILKLTGGEVVDTNRFYLHKEKYLVLRLNQLPHGNVVNLYEETDIKYVNSYQSNNISNRKKIISLDDNNNITYYESILSAVNIVKCSPRNIRAALRNGTKCAGYKWSFLD